MRQLLALIALLTGLAALAEPVRAAETAVERVTMQEVAACHVQAAQIAVRMVPRPKSDCVGGIIDPLQDLALATPTIILQADRARE